MHCASNTVNYYSAYTTAFSGSYILRHKQNRKVIFGYLLTRKWVNFIVSKIFAYISINWKKFFRENWLCANIVSIFKFLKIVSRLCESLWNFQLFLVISEPSQFLLGLGQHFLQKVCTDSTVMFFQLFFEMQFNFSDGSDLFVARLWEMRGSGQVGQVRERRRRIHLPGLSTGRPAKITHW